MPTSGSRTVCCTAVHTQTAGLALFGVFKTIFAVLAVKLVFDGALQTHSASIAPVKLAVVADFLALGADIYIIAAFFAVRTMETVRESTL